MLIQQFSERAAECMKLAGRARSEHDRTFLIAMACAWCGAIIQDERQRDLPQRMH